MNRLIDYLKTASTTDLVKCTCPSWYPTIESPGTKGAFLTQNPEEIYSSDKPPIMDVMFGIANVEAIQVLPNLLTDTEPLLGMDWKETNIRLRYEGFSKEANPKVNV